MPTGEKKNTSRIAIVEKTCVPCGINSASHSTCDASLKNDREAACSQCIAMNRVCFYRDDTKQKKSDSIGHIYCADPILDIEMGSNQGRSAHISSWNNNRGNKRAQFEKVMELWDVRSNLPDVPNTTEYPNYIPLSDDENDDDSKEMPDAKPELFAVVNDRFKLPSNDLMGAIYTLAHENLEQDPSIFGTFQPNALVALSFLLQEVALASQDQDYSKISKRSISTYAPNICDVLGPEFRNQDFRTRLLETLKPRRKRKRPEHLFSGREESF